jgi:hypothetical protein
MIGDSPTVRIYQRLVSPAKQDGATRGRWKVVACGIVAIREG